jgi:hypothetical protein
MTDRFSNAQQIRKPAVVSKGGMVAAQSCKAPEGAAWRRAHIPSHTYGGGHVFGAFARCLCPRCKGRRG